MLIDDINCFQRLYDLQYVYIVLLYRHEQSEWGRFTFKVFPTGLHLNWSRDNPGSSDEGPGGPGMMVHNVHF